MEGNQMKMREALENSNGLLEELTAIGDWGESAREQIAENNAALSAPPRQCDVGTAEEQAQRFEKFCKKRSMSGFGASAYCAHECACKDGSCCEFAWAQTPYAEEGGAGK